MALIPRYGLVVLYLCVNNVQNTHISAFDIFYWGSLITLIAL